MILKKIKNRIQRALRDALNFIFPFFEKLGIHILPVSFYSPIPEVGKLDPSLFAKESEGAGINWNLEKQFGVLQDLSPYIKEREFEKNEGLSVLDSAILHAMIRHQKPKRVIEIGAGQSTLFILQALKLLESEGHPSSFTTIEPYLNSHLRRLFPPGLDIVESVVQKVPTEFFSDCDLLFIDSSHVAKIGSDVNYEILEIVPRLKPGALVHFHDICFPKEYHSAWVNKNHYFWNEQYMLQAFLAFNNQFEVLWASSYMQSKAFKELKEAFPSVTPSDGLSSFWIQRVGKR